MFENIVDYILHFLKQYKLLFLFVLLGGFMFGMVSRKKIARTIMKFVFVPIVFSIAWFYFYGIRSNLSPIENIFFSVGFYIIIIFGALRLLLTKDLWNNFVGSFLYDLFRFILTAPVRAVRFTFVSLFRKK